MVHSKSFLSLLKDVNKVRKVHPKDMDSTDALNAVLAYTEIKKRLRNKKTRKDGTKLTNEFIRRWTAKVFKTRIEYDTEAASVKFFPVFLLANNPDNMLTTVDKLTDKNVYRWDGNKFAITGSMVGRRNFDNMDLRLAWNDRIENIVQDKANYKLSLDHEPKSTIGRNLKLNNFSTPYIDNTLYLGVEIEVGRKELTPRDLIATVYKDLNPDFNLRATQRRDWPNAGIKFGFCKSDSSIPEHGFEIVSAPATLAYHKVAWAKFFKNSAKYLGSYVFNNVEGHDGRPKSCGMHIHLSSNSFQGILHKGKFVKFINMKENREFVSRVAGRPAVEFKRGTAQNDEFNLYSEPKVTFFTEKKSGKLVPALRKAADGGHHAAVDTHRPNTVELRIFRGNVKKEGFFKNIEFAHAVFNFTKDASATKLESTEFLNWINNPANGLLYPYLTKWLHVKGYIDSKFVRIPTVRTFDDQSILEDFIREVA